MASFNPSLGGKFTEGFVTPPPTASVELKIDGECFGLFKLDAGNKFNPSVLTYYPLSANRWINSIQLQRDDADGNVTFAIFYNNEDPPVDPQVSHTVDMYFYPAKDSSNIFYAKVSSIVPLDTALIAVTSGGIDPNNLIQDYIFMTALPRSGDATA
jgi:hypothetical protein